MRLIAISGKRGSGKDTAATIISELIAPELNWQNLKFADKLKRVAAEMTGENIETMYSQTGKTKYLPGWQMTVGEFQQLFGCKVRELNPNAWVLPVLGSLRQLGNYIITDVRFPNEAEAIRAQGGVIIRLEGNPAGMQGDGTRDDNHISETALDGYDFDVTIRNDSNLAHLRDQLQRFLYGTGIL